MYLPRSRNTLFQRVDLIVLILLEQLDLHLVFQAEQKRRPDRVSLNLLRPLQQLVSQGVLVHIKWKVPPLHSQRLQRMQNIILHRLRTKLTLQLLHGRFQILEPLTISFLRLLRYGTLQTIVEGSAPAVALFLFDRAFSVYIGPNTEVFIKERRAASGC